MDSEWKRVSLNDITTELSDGLHKAPEFAYNGEYLFVNATNIEDGKIVEKDKAKRTTYEEFLKYNTPLTSRTILYSIDGTIGNIARYRGEKCILGKGACYINVKNCVDVDYIYYLLQSADFNNYIHKMATGSTIKHISLKTMRNYTFTLPPFAIQQRISQILKSFDDKIDLNNRINKTLEEMAQAIFKSWFIDFEPFKDGEFVDSELGRIPKGWRVGTLGDFADISTESFSPQKNAGVIVEHYSIPAYDDKHFPVYEPAENIKSNKYYVNQMCFLYSKLNPSIKRIWMPLCLNNPCICSTEFIVYKIKNEQSFTYCFSVVNSSSFYDFINSIVTGSTGSRQRSHPKDTLLFPVLIPPANIIKQFSIIVTNLYDSIKNNQIQNNRLEKVRNILLPKLMSGEIRIPLNNQH